MTRVDRKPFLQSTLHMAKWRISTLANTQFVPHKCGHQYIITIMLLALTISCDGGALLQHKVHTSASSSPSSCVAAKLL